MTGSELFDIEQEGTLLIEKFKWGAFFTSFDGHNVEVACWFSLYFKENVAQIKDLRLDISEDFVAKTKKITTDWREMVQTRGDK